MKKSDNSIYSVCIASIKRSTILPYDFKWTRFYPNNAEFYSTYPDIGLTLLAEELIICSTIINPENYSVLTTRKLVTKDNGIMNSGKLEGSIDKLYGDFKGNLENKAVTFGLVQLADGNNLKYLIETGKASMVMIHGVRTSIRITR